MAFGAVGFGTTRRVGSASAQALAPSVSGGPVDSAGAFGTAIPLGRPLQIYSNEWEEDPGSPSGFERGGLGESQTSNNRATEERCRACCGVAWDEFNALGYRTRFCKNYTTAGSWLGRSCWMNRGNSVRSWRGWCGNVAEYCNCYRM